MKNNTKRFYLLSALSVFLLVFGVKVSALSVGVNTKAEVEVGSKTSASATGTVKMESGERNDDGDDNSSATSSDKREDNENLGDEHRSAVSTVVKNLLMVANRDGGIGAEVRLVAQEQASTSAKVKTDIDELNSESKLKVFLLGPNYRNIGELRSTIVTTQNHIERLKKAEQKTASVSVKADLQAQIKALEGISSSTQAFVEANENKLSLFGWVVHIFVK
ncbi:MAG: hypothetical protein AB201_01935 [Parcubacteria bacterium C7867-006]|nr:MAG: hypothetical protein AB201_01935 [Parcubacteria bacterium C7867-006]